MNKKLFYLLYTGILILAFLLRFYRLGEIPFGTYWDETAILADAKKVVTTGTDLHGLSPWHLIYPSYGDYKLAPYIWTTIASVRFLGVNAFALRLPSALAGLLTVIIAGLIAKNLALFSRPAAKTPPSLPHPRVWQLTTMLTVAIAPWSILFSRTAFEGHLAQMLLAAAVLLLIYALRPTSTLTTTKRQRTLTLICLLLSGLLGGLALWAYFSVRFVWPVVFCLFIGYFLLKTRQWPKMLLSFAIIGVIFGFFLYTMTITSFYHRSNKIRLSTDSILNQINLPHQVTAQRQLSGGSLFSRLLFTQKGTQVTQLLQNLAAHLDPGFLFLHGDENLRHSTTVTGLFYLIMFPFLLWGIISWWRHDRLLLLMILGWWFVSLIPASVPLTGVPHALRSLNALVPLSLLISFGFAHLFSPPKTRPGRHFWTFVVTCTVGCLLFSLIHFSWYYFQIYPTISATHWQTNSLRHSEILTHEKAHYSALYTTALDNYTYLWYFNQPNVDLSHLGPSQEFVFHQVENLHFNALPPANLTQPVFLLGEATVVTDFLRTRPDLLPQILYDYESFSRHFLGVSLTPIP